LGVGAIVAFSKSKKHYVGVTWVNGESRGGIALQADKNEYRGLIAALEGVSGKTAVNADSAPASREHPQSASLATPAPESATTKPIVVRFASVPANAEVQVDGEYWGNTPTADLARLQAGSHTIVVRKAGYEQWERRITLAVGDDRTISAELQASATEASRLAPVSDAVGSDPREATASSAVYHESIAPKTIIVRFSSTPASAEVNIDGEYWGTTPTTDFTRLSAGSHTILVRKVGYEPWERKITLAEGDDRTISAELKPNDASKPRINGLD
jgi:CRISPR/Cas system-associated exonuclease Cas4 (RecB family)